MARLDLGCYSVFGGDPAARKWALVWNFAGIVDLVMALVLGVLTGFPTDLPLTVVPNVTTNLGIMRRQARTPEVPGEPTKINDFLLDSERIMT